MRKEKIRKKLSVAIAIALNFILIFTIIYSVVSAINNANALSFAQNVENIRTLTDSSANMVQMAVSGYTETVRNAASYINGYRGVGMTKAQLSAYMRVYYDPALYNWQLVDSVPDNVSERTSEQGFWSDRFQNGAGRKMYSYYAYPALAQILALPSALTVGDVYYINEFTDIYSLKKSFAVATAVRLLTEDGVYEYRTLMLVITSDAVNSVLASNSTTDALSYYNYASIIVDAEGNYVISNRFFQGTNFLTYIETFDSSFTGAEKAALLDRLATNDIGEPLRYRNNREADSLYTLSIIPGTDWFVLSLVPINSFHNSNGIGWDYYVFFIAFLLLFLVDILYMQLINRRLRVKTREAEEANEAKSQFLSSMSHDIRTPMNAIIGMTVVVNKHLEEENLDREILKDGMKTIELSSNHLLTLINDILDISKIESGKVVLHSNDFSITNALSKTIEILQPKLKEKDFAFTAHARGIVHEFVCTDELRINQIFINILSNAVKYTNDGGKIDVDLSEAPFPNHEGVARYIFSVRDTGIGMSKDFIKKIYDPFSRAVDTRVNNVQGSGLGLAIVKQLVDLFGGSIQIDSEINKGSAFTLVFDLPISKSEPNQRTFNGVSVLLIDDDPLLLDAARTLLTEMGLAVDMTLNASEGIRMATDAHARKADYKIIFVDWRMTQMSGSAVLRELRRALGPGTALVVMTAYNIVEVEQAAREAGATAFVTKPLFRSQLTELIQTTLSGAKNKKPTVTDTFPDIRILAAEDNSVNWRVLSRLLSFHSVTADHAQNGAEAVEMVKASDKPYDLIFMDIQMPVMNGYQATAAIRALDDPAKASVPIYAMTADTFDEDVRKSIDVGMNGHIPKPIDVDSVVRVIREADNRRRQSLT